MGDQSTECFFGIFPKSCFNRKFPIWCRCIPSWKCLSLSWIPCTSFWKFLNLTFGIYRNTLHPFGKFTILLRVSELCMYLLLVISQSCWKFPEVTIWLGNLRNSVPSFGHFLIMLWFQKSSCECCTYFWKFISHALDQD